MLVALFGFRAHVRDLGRNHAFLDQIPKVFPRFSKDVEIGSVILFHQQHRCSRYVDRLGTAFLFVDRMDLVKTVKGDVEPDTKKHF